MASKERMRSYKNKAKDNEELRRRREEEGVQLRKQKRDEQVHNSFISIKGGVNKSRSALCFGSQLKISKISQLTQF